MFDAVLTLAKLAFGPPGLGEITAIAIALAIWAGTVPAHLKSRPRFAALALAIAAAAVATGVAVGASVGSLVMFGPSLLTGDFVALPWLTLLPALGLGGVAGVAATSRLCVEGRRHLLLAVTNDPNIRKVRRRPSAGQWFVKGRDLVQQLSFLCLPLALGFRHWVAAGICAVAFLASALSALQQRDQDDREG